MGIHDFWGHVDRSMWKAVPLEAGPARSKCPDNDVRLWWLWCEGYCLGSCTWWERECWLTVPSSIQHQPSSWTPSQSLPSKNMDLLIGLWLKGFSVSGKFHWDLKSHSVVELSLLTIVKMRWLCQSCTDIVWEWINLCWPSHVGWWCRYNNLNSELIMCQESLWEHCMY